MKIRAKTLFSDAEKEKIRQAVKDAEGSTPEEIAVMVVDESDRYWEAEWAGALALSALIALVLAITLRNGTVWFFIPVTAVLFFPFVALFRRLPHLKLALLSHRRVEEAVRERAVYAFFQKGVHETEMETGILIFISLLERKVWILGDKGIHGKIGSDFWRSLADELASGIREDRPLEALCTVIEKCGAELTRHFPGPHAKDDPPDDVIL